MSSHAADLAHRLAREAEAVCRRYLPEGRREGGYWRVGDVRGAPGRSMFVRLMDSPQGLAGKWTDACTGEHGDLLDVIAATHKLATLREVLHEARAFLSMPRWHGPDEPPGPRGSPQAARRLFSMAGPIRGTLAQTYLNERAITGVRDFDALRFHPRCYYRPCDQDTQGTPGAWPALIAAVTDLDGKITGAHRTWLDPSGRAKAPVATPRRAMGNLLGHAVRFGVARDVMAAGEGIETVASLRSILPSLPMAAALSAVHLGALIPPTSLRRLYIAHDGDPAGRGAAERLSGRMHEIGIEAVTLTPALGDFNDDLRRLGIEALAASLRMQLVAEDVARFWRPKGAERV